jgi:hypothetical protein
MMFAYCSVCKYDSGDAQDADALVEKVKADGGDAENTGKGIFVSCPNCKTDKNMRID